MNSNSWAQLCGLRDDDSQSMKEKKKNIHNFIAGRVGAFACVCVSHVNSQYTQIHLVVSTFSRTCAHTHIHTWHKPMLNLHELREEEEERGKTVVKW